MIEVKRYLKPDGYPTRYWGISTIGIDSSLGHDGCHHSVAGYQIIANLVAPLVERDF